MMLSSANIPVPSGVVMPFGGILASRGVMNFHLVALAGTTGATIGSLLNYALGAKLGKEFLLKYGKYFFIRPKEVEMGEKWFEKHGLLVTLWGRCVPVVRTFVSLPAGIYRADLKLFTLYAFVGTLPYAYLFTYIGLKVGDNWESLSKNLKYMDAAAVLLVLVLIAKFAHYRLKEKNQAA